MGRADGGGDGRRPGSTAVGPGGLGAGDPVRSSGSGVDRDGFRVSRRLPLGGSGWAPLPPLEGPVAGRDRGSLGLAAGSRSALPWALAGPVTLPSPAAPQKLRPNRRGLLALGVVPPLPSPHRPPSRGRRLGPHQAVACVLADAAARLGVAGSARGRRWAAMTPQLPSVRPSTITVPTRWARQFTQRWFRPSRVFPRYKRTSPWAPRVFHPFLEGSGTP